MGRNALEEPRAARPGTATRKPLPCNAIASAQPTGPATRMTTSAPSASGARIAHQRLDVRHRLGPFGAQDFAAVGVHQHVVLDAHADVAQPLRDVVPGADV